MGIIRILLLTSLVHGKNSQCQNLAMYSRVVQILLGSGSLNDDENDNENTVCSFKGRVWSAVLSLDWLSIGIKVHVPVFGDYGVKSRVCTL